MENNDLGYLCTTLLTRGVAKKEIIEIARKCEVSMFTIPGTSNYENVDIAGLFGSMALGGALGSFVGYYQSGGDVGLSILSGLAGLVAGGMLWKCGVMGDQHSNEKEMVKELRRHYSNLL
jgi:hypothetical protein